MVIDVEHKHPGAIEKFGDNMPRLSSLIASAIAFEYADHVKRNKLSGQALNVRTPGAQGAKGSTKVIKARGKEGQMIVRPGIGVRGMLNYLFGFERGFGGQLSGLKRPFMRPAAQEFKGRSEHNKIAERVIEAMIKRGGFR